MEGKERLSEYGQAPVWVESIERVLLESAEMTWGTSLLALVVFDWLREILSKEAYPDLAQPDRKRIRLMMHPKTSAGTDLASGFNRAKLSGSPLGQSLTPIREKHR